MEKVVRVRKKSKKVRVFTVECGGVLLVKIEARADNEQACRAACGVCADFVFSGFAGEDFTPEIPF